MLWRIGLSPDEFQSQTAAINKSVLGGYLTMPWSFVSMTKRSMYIDKVDPFTASRAALISSPASGSICLFIPL